MNDPYEMNTKSIFMHVAENTNQYSSFLYEHAQKKYKVLKKLVSLQTIKNRVTMSNHELLQQKVISMINVTAISV